MPPRWRKSPKCTALQSFIPCSRKRLGRVTKMDAETIGRASLLLGAGRQKVDDTIDFAVGFSGIKKVGEPVEKGEPLLFVHARSDQTLHSVLPLLERAMEVGRNKPVREREDRFVPWPSNS